MKKMIFMALAFCMLSVSLSFGKPLKPLVQYLSYNVKAIFTDDNGDGHYDYVMIFIGKNYDSGIKLEPLKKIVGSDTTDTYLDDTYFQNNNGLITEFEFNNDTLTKFCVVYGDSTSNSYSKLF